MFSTKRSSLYIILIFGLTVLFYLPILLNPPLILSRSNDLENFFWPLLYFVKTQIINHHTFPLWNNLFFSGSPLLADPQSPLFYPPNAIFLILPINLGIILSVLGHIFFAGIGAFFCARQGLKFSNTSSLFVATLFIINTRLAGYLEAGHLGLIYSYTFIPYLIWATIQIFKSPNISWLILYSLSLSGIFLTHTVTFLISVIFSLLLFVSLFFESHIKYSKRSFLYLGLGLLITLGLVAVVLLPQLNWSSQTTRFILLKDHDVYPKWTSVKEFLEIVFIPWNQGVKFIWNIDTEKWLATGIALSLLSFYGFINLGKKLKVLTVILAIFVTLVSLNNVSPIYKLLISLDTYVLARVSTRIWIIASMVMIFLSGFALEKLIKKNIKPVLIWVVVLLVFSETTILFWVKMAKPIPKPKGVPLQVYDFIKNDHDHFRVFCTTVCLSQKAVAQNGLETIEGYNTVQQINYYQHAWQLTNSFWNYYTLSIPPVGIYTYEKIQPDAKSLADYNVKYVISPHQLSDHNFSLLSQIGNYFIYQNNLYKSRAYYSVLGGPDINAQITTYSPNFIKIDTQHKASNSLILAEVYSPGWTAYLNGQEKSAVSETPISLRQINLKSDTDFVELKYIPPGYSLGKKISLATLFVILFLIFYEIRNRKLSI